MPELLVSHGGKKFFGATVNATPFTIGSSSECDLVLSGDDVAATHARLVRGEGACRLEQVAAKALLVNGESFCSGPLKNRDRIVIGAWTLEFCEVGVFAGPIADGTRLDREPADILGALKTPMLLIRDEVGGHSHVIQRKKTLIIGSAPECDVVLADAYVSRKHAVFTLTSRGFCVRDLGSTNGTLVDGARVQEAYIKGDRDIVLGRTRIRLCFREQEAKPLAAGFFGMVGESPAMRTLFLRLERVARSDKTVLIQGPTGSGKELAAHAVHKLSPRGDKPYVAINCGAIAANLVESELFGHEKGAFTGAEQRHRGAFEQADGGTLFLDEVGELPLSTQAKLLRALEYKTVRRVGGEADVAADARVVAATHRDLAGLVATGRFRADLFYRLFVLPLAVPPLCERGEDVVTLAQIFLREAGGEALRFDESALDKIRAYNWPGNVRELKNTVLRAAAFCEAGTVRALDLAFAAVVQPVESGAAEPLSFTAFVEKRKAETESIRQALRQAGGDKEKAAALLGIGRSTIFRRIKELEIR